MFLLDRLRGDDAGVNEDVDGLPWIACHTSASERWLVNSWLNPTTGFHEECNNPVIPTHIRSKLPAEFQQLAISWGGQTSPILSRVIIVLIVQKIEMIRRRRE
jgi:hypothetical protein